MLRFDSDHHSAVEVFTIKASKRPLVLQVIPRVQQMRIKSAVDARVLANVSGASYTQRFAKPLIV